MDAPNELERNCRSRLLMSRVVEDETQSCRILDAAARRLLGRTNQGGRRRARASSPRKQRGRARRLPKPTKRGGGA